MQFRCESKRAFYGQHDGFGPFADVRKGNRPRLNLSIRYRVTSQKEQRTTHCYVPMAPSSCLLLKIQMGKQAPEKADPQPTISLSCPRKGEAGSHGKSRLLMGNTNPPGIQNLYIHPSARNIPRPDKVAICQRKHLPFQTGVPLTGFLHRGRARNHRSGSGESPFPLECSP
jgi:hypothetical protein